MRIFRFLGLIGVAACHVWFIVVVVDYSGKILNEPGFWWTLVLLGLLLCNFVNVKKDFASATKDGDDSLFFLWVKAKKEKLKKEIKEINND